VTEPTQGGGALLDALLGFAIALAIGALVGVEREQKKRAEHAGTGGLRTFVLLAEAGAVAAWLARELAAPWIFAGLGVAATALIVAGYLAEARARPKALGLTTEVAGLVVFLLGGLAVVGQRELAVALAIATTSVLAFKEPLHGWIARLGRDDVEAGLKLLMATFIVLPVLPDRAVDPWGALNPRSMWWLVILISSMSLAGYVGTRWLGSERGLALTGIAGGLVSSTATTLGFARQSREREASDSLAGALLLAWTVMFGRVAVEVGVVHRALLSELALPLGAMGLATLGAGLYHLRRGLAGRGAARAQELALKNPFRLTASIRFAAFFAVVLLAVALARRTLPEGGLYVVAALAGLTDVDAITLSMAELARDAGTEATSTTAAGAIVTAVLTNTLVKCGLVAALATPALRARVLRATVLVGVLGVAALLV